MLMNILRIPVSLVLLAAMGGIAPATPASAQSAYTEHTLRLDDPTRRPAATIQDVAWLAGHWRGEGLGGTIDEIWSPPQGTTMICAFKLSKADTVSFYELAVFVEEANSLSMWVKHFNPDFTGWEEKTEKVVFPLVRLEPDALYFEGLTFDRTGEEDMDVYLAFSSRGGEVREAKLVYRRMR